MKTIETVLRSMTDAKAITQDMLDTLREMDPEFPEMESRFHQASTELQHRLAGKTVPSACEYLAAKETAFGMELLCIGWQGFQLNLDIFRNPVNALRLKEDYEDMHCEHQLGTLPTARKARETQRAFYAALKELPEEIWELTDGVNEFYAYLETAGYKIAHYFGFRLAEAFLPYAVPGYTAGHGDARRYSAELKRYLQTDLSRVG